MNGGGEIVRGLIKGENDIQSAAHSKELEERFKRHEAEESHRFERIEDEVFKRPRRQR